MRTRARAADCGYRTGLSSDSAGRRHSEGQHSMQPPLQFEPFPARLADFSGGSNLNFFYCTSTLLLVACGSIPSHLSNRLGFPLLYSVSKVIQLMGRFLFLLCVILLAGSSGNATNVFVLTIMSPSFGLCCVISLVIGC